MQTRIISFLVAWLVKNPPAMWETWVQSLGWGRSSGSSGNGYSLQILAWRISWTVQSMGSQSWTQLSDFTSLHIISFTGYLKSVSAGLSPYFGVGFKEL